MNAPTLDSLYMSQNHQNLTLTNCTLNSENRIVKITLTTGLGNNPGPKVVTTSVFYLSNLNPLQSKPIAHHGTTLFPMDHMIHIIPQCAHPTMTETNTSTRSRVSTVSWRIQSSRTSVHTSACQIARRSPTPMKWTRHTFTHNICARRKKQEK